MERAAEPLARNERPRLEAKTDRVIPSSSRAPIRRDAACQGGDRHSMRLSAMTHRAEMLAANQIAACRALLPAGSATCVDVVDHCP